MKGEKRVPIPRNLLPDPLSDDQGDCREHEGGREIEVKLSEEEKYKDWLKLMVPKLTESEIRDIIPIIKDAHNTGFLEGSKHKALRESA